LHYQSVLEKLCAFLPTKSLHCDIDDRIAERGREIERQRMQNDVLRRTLAAMAGEETDAWQGAYSVLGNLVDMYKKRCESICTLAKDAHQRLESEQERLQALKELEKMQRANRYVQSLRVCTTAPHKRIRR
jgi:hypothetical protein